MNVELHGLEETVRAIVREELERLAGQNGGSPWMTRAQAAEYLGGVPVSRLEKDKTVPCHRWDGRILYRRDELDDWLSRG